MSIPVSIFFFLFGLFLMIYGADRLVTGGSTVARHFRISPLVIGLTIVSFGTSFPEFAASLVGALKGKTDIALGNVVGSNICNIGLVLGAAACVRPVRVDAGIVRREIPLVLLVSLLAWGMVWNNLISRVEGVCLSLLFGLYIWYCVHAARRDHKALPVDGESSPGDFPGKAGVQIGFGVVCLFIGADLFIRSATSAAERFGIQQAIIGLTLVALGTSLPELVTSIVAMIKNEGDIGLGNVLGSNIFNLLFVLGVTSAISPIRSSDQFFRADMPIMIAFVLVLLPALGKPMRIGRFKGLFLLAAYGLYMLFLGRLALLPMVS